MSDRSYTVPTIQEILARYRETRPPLKKVIDLESVFSTAFDLALWLDEADEFRDVVRLDYVAFVETLQEWVTEPVTSDVDRQTIRVEIDLDQPTWRIVRNILDAAGGRVGAIAHHMVGAALQINLGDSGLVVESHRYTTAEVVPGQPGDFRVNDSVFRVRLSPTVPVIQACARDLIAGYKSYLLISDAHIATARALAMMADIFDQVVIMPVDQFIGHSLDTMSGFSRDRLMTLFRLLLETYNIRVQAVETDPSLLIEIPENLS